MTDTLLVDAVSALKTKIESAAGTATPEELAYLGTAIDRIGGRATVLEVMVFGDQKKAELTALAATKTTEATDAINAVKTSALSTMATSATDAIDSVETTSSDAIAEMQAAADAAVESVETTSSDAIAEMQAAAGQLTQQLVFGRKTYFYGQL